MEILYSNEIFSYENASHYEGIYRLAGIRDIGKEVFIDQSVHNIRRIYSERYLTHIRCACEGSYYLKSAEMSCTKNMYKSAVASTNLAVLAAMNGDFAVTRPPGHHSGPNYAKGFCLFNNVAIATSVLLEAGKRVAILDIDGHYGNGTEAIFSTNDNVFYGSLHQKGSFLLDKRCRGNAKKKRKKGLSIMVGLEQGTNDEQYLEKLAGLVGKVQKFSPDYIAVSAGFDTFNNDSLLALNCTENVYFDVGKMIAGISQNVFAVLEGGYHHSISECISNFVAGVNSIIPDSNCNSK